MALTKHIIKAGTYSTTAGGANTFTPTSSIGLDGVDYNKLNVIFNVKTLSGTTPTIQPSVQERFSDIGFVETANWGATITSTGVYVLSMDGQTNQVGAANIKYGFALLGNGTDKQVVFTNGGTINSVTVDIYFNFFS